MLLFGGDLEIVKVVKPGTSIQNSLGHNMKTIILFLKWFFIPYGVTKVHPAMTLRYFPGAPPGSIETIAEGKLAKILKEQECVICGTKCWARNKKAPPICTTWGCFKEYFKGK